MSVSAIVVDDEFKNRQTLIKLLDQFCYGVKVVGDAENISSAKLLINKLKLLPIRSRRNHVY